MAESKLVASADQKEIAELADKASMALYRLIERCEELKVGGIYKANELFGDIVRLRLKGADGKIQSNSY